MTCFLRLLTAAIKQESLVGSSTNNYTGKVDQIFMTLLPPNTYFLSCGQTTFFILQAVTLNPVIQYVKPVIEKSKSCMMTPPFCWVILYHPRHVQCHQLVAG